MHAKLNAQLQGFDPKLGVYFSTVLFLNRFVSYFCNFGVTTIILRNRLRRDGYDPLTDEVNDAQQAIRLVRSRAKEWNIDPARIGMMGFSAGAELVAPAAIAFDRFDQPTRPRAIRWPG